jgi:hypothetical protein
MWLVSGWVTICVMTYCWIFQAPLILCVRWVASVVCTRKALTVTLNLYQTLQNPGGHKSGQDGRACSLNFQAKVVIRYPYLTTYTYIYLPRYISFNDVTVNFDT